MRKIVIDADRWIKDMEEGKYQINTSAYAKGCNDVLNYYIEKLKYVANEQCNSDGLNGLSLFKKRRIINESL